MADPSLPLAHHLKMQYRWLQGGRSRLFRFVDLYNKEKILDLGSGAGHVTAELTRRTNGVVIALDRSQYSLHEEPYPRDAFRIAGRAAEIPLFDRSIDLVFTQNALMWMKPLSQVMSEIQRIVKPGGWLTAVEPDYGGYIEFPPALAIKEIWITALKRAGAEPLIGRALPSLLESIGFTVNIFLLDRLEEAGLGRFELLEDLPLSKEEAVKIAEIKQKSTSQSDWHHLVHLPYFLIAARKT